MIRTQIQLPDVLYKEVKRVAAEREMSLAEVVRRGLEMLLARLPEDPMTSDAWDLPEARSLGGDSFFDDPDWRYKIHEDCAVVREKPVRYRSRRKRSKE